MRRRLLDSSSRLLLLGRGLALGRLLLLLLRRLLRCLLLLLLLLLFLLLIATVLLLFPQLVAPGLVTRDAVVGLLESGDLSRRLEVLEQVTLLMSLKLAALLHAVHALARLVAVGSFDLRRGAVGWGQTGVFHATKAGNDVEVILLDFVVLLPGAVSISTAVAKHVSLHLITVAVDALRLVVQGPVVAHHGRVNRPGVVQVGLGLVHVVMLVVVVVVEPVIRHAVVIVIVFCRLEDVRDCVLFEVEEWIPGVAIVLSMLVLFGMVLVTVMVISVARLVVEHVAGLSQIRRLVYCLCEVHHGAVHAGRLAYQVALVDELVESAHVLRRLRHGMICQHCGEAGAVLYYFNFNISCQSQLTIVRGFD